jgi:penicillin-binding protein 2
MILTDLSSFVFSNFLCIFANYMKRYLLIIITALLSFTNLFGQVLPTDGKLTINTKLQKLGERLMQSKQGCIVAIEPETGEIKCMVSTSFEGDSINRAIGMEYSPGSTFKPAQALTLLSEFIVNKDSKYTCHKGFWNENIHIGCHEHRSPQDLIGALANSCNSWFCKAFMAMIKDRKKYETKLVAIDTWKQYMSSYGFGAPLGIDMPGEKGGMMPDSKLLEQEFNGRWNQTTIMWVGMGQGEATVTPIQLCNLAALIANRGYYYIPHIHKDAGDEYKEKHVAKASEKAFETVIEGMRKAVLTGTAHSICKPDWQICGKTGTAENPGDDHSIFIGFAPMDKPKIAICTFIENGGFGADMAAPISQLMIEQYLTGKLSAHSEHKVRQWENFLVIPHDPADDIDTFVEVPEPVKAKPIIKKPRATTAKKNAATKPNQVKKASVKTVVCKKKAKS